MMILVKFSKSTPSMILAREIAIGIMD